MQRSQKQPAKKESSLRPTSLESERAAREKTMERQPSRKPAGRTRTQTLKTKPLRLPDSPTLIHYLGRTRPLAFRRATRQSFPLEIDPSPQSDRPSRWRISDRVSGRRGQHSLGRSE